MRADGGLEEGEGGVAEAAAGEDVGDGDEGVEVVAAERVALGPKEESEGEMGAVADTAEDLGGLGSGESGGVEHGFEEAPPALGTLLP